MYYVRAGYQLLIPYTDRDSGMTGYEIGGYSDYTVSGKAELEALSRSHRGSYVASYTKPVSQHSAYPEQGNTQTHIGIIDGRWHTWASLEGNPTTLQPHESETQAREVFDHLVTLMKTNGVVQ